MLNPIFYISNKYSDFNYSFSENAATYCYVSFIVDASDILKLEEAYCFFSEKNTAGFSLSLSINKAVDTEFLYCLAAFFFLPGYLKFNNRIIINFIGNDLELLSNTKNELLEISVNQSISNLEVNVLAYDDSKISNNIKYNLNQLFSNIDSFKLHYVNTLQSPIFYNNCFYLHHSAINIKDLSFSIDSANEEIKTNNRPLYDALLKMQLLLLHNADLKLKYTGLVNELENHKTHIDMLKSAHEATELQIYYDKEYEVLPIWYKRVGHLLKVIMGKRSFRSLFTNKTKKA